MRVVLIDNRDSFTYNLEQQIRSLGADCIVVPSHATSLREIKRLRPQRIVISPGPGRPEESGVSLVVLPAFLGRVPILGVCLGHQCIGTVFGGERRSVIHAPTVMHGKTSLIYHSGEGLMTGLKSPFRAARYHSLILKDVPPKFKLMCWTGSQTKPDLIMGIRHESEPLFGVQFHPESFLTENGDTLMRNFLEGRW
ncbi:MAG: aminodeoxychorismate/anthranilate synthase component II [Candidatus Peribacteraceae bacterium]